MGRGLRGCRWHAPAAAPVALRTADRVRLAGTLARVIRLLQATALRCAEPATAPVWRARLRDTLDALAATSDDTAWLRREVETHLDAFVDQLAGGPETPVPSLSREAVLQWFRGDFELPQRGDRPITGGVTVCALQPMRSVPFRIVALVGMDDGSFPRGGSPRTWDPFDDRRLGERDGREVDRHLLLEALMSARDAFWILWTGFSVTRGDERPAAVPVEELLETLGRAAVPGEDDEAQRRALVRPHPLQPWGYGEALGARPRCSTCDWRGRPRPWRGAAPGGRRRLVTRRGTGLSPPKMPASGLPLARRRSSTQTRCSDPSRIPPRP